MRSHRSWSTLYCLLLASAVPAAHAQSPGVAPVAPPADDHVIEGLQVQPGGLTAAQTAQRALAASSSVREKQAQLEAARARIAQTTIDFFPKLSLRASYTRLSPSATSLGGGALVGARTPGVLQVAACDAPSGFCPVDAAGDPIVATQFDIEFIEDNYAVAANLTIPLSDYVLRVASAAAAASSSKEAANFALQAERRKVQTDAQVLYYQWLRAQAQIFIARRAVERTRGRLEDARAALSVGRLSNADVLRFEAQSARAELALTQVDSLRLLTEAQLAIITEDRSGAVYTVGQSVPDLGATAPVDRAQVKVLLAEANANRLELKALDATIRSLDHGRDAVEAGAWPRISAVGEATYANPNPRYFPPVRDWKTTWSVGVAATFSADDPFMSAARSRELGATLESAQAQRRALEAAITNEVVTAQLQVTKSQAAIGALQTALRAAEESYRVTSELFRVGRATPSDVIDAESELFGAKAQLADARIESVIARLQLDQALGRERAGGAR